MHQLHSNIGFKDLMAYNFIFLSEEDKKVVLEMRNHSEIRKWMKNQQEISLENHLNFIEKLKSSNSDFYWLVKNKKSTIPIGVIYINKLNLDKRTGEFGIYANPTYSEKGKGKALSEMELHIIFELLNLDEVYLECDPANNRAKALYNKLGFEITIPSDPTYVKMKLNKSKYYGNKK